MSQISSFINIRPVGAELFHSDGQTNMAELRLAFRNFANAPKDAGPYSLHYVFFLPTINSLITPYSVKQLSTLKYASVACTPLHWLISLNLQQLEENLQFMLQKIQLPQETLNVTTY